MIYRNNSYGPIDRFCARHPRFGIPNLMKILVIAQIVVFVMNLIGSFMKGPGLPFIWYLEFIPALILEGQVWRLVSWVLVPHSSNLFYMLLGSYFYFWIGSQLEREWGTARFSLFYLSGIVISVLVGGALSFAQPAVMEIGMPLDLSYYLNLSIFLIIATMFGEMRVMLFFVIPIKMKWAALIDVILIAAEMIELLQIGVWSLALVPLASILNYFIFTWPFWSMKLGMARRKTDPQVINFKKAQKEAQKKVESAQYRHKCAVCGITDADDPNMEFRYCSRCDGYHCYCANHINNHVHIHED